ncbi:hypothetical protein FLM52_00445 [bacterium Scap17]|nr:hypothetical protein [bacterium Scap17]
MEEKLKRLKEFNSKPKRPSQRSECKWCKEEIQPRALICASCQQPQRKRHWLLAHPSVAVSAMSILISSGSFWVAWKANNPPPAAPKVGAYIGGYDKEGFHFTTYNYGNAPTALSAVDLKITLEDNDTTHSSYAFFELAEPVFLPIGSTRETIAIDYDSLTPNRSKWRSTGEDKEFNLGFLSVAAAWGSNLDCEITLWYSVAGTMYNHDSSTLYSNGNCVPAMAWMAQSFGPFEGKPITDEDWIYRVKAQPR